MCGIAGFVDIGRRSTDERLRDLAGKMAETLRRRGPDDSGVWSDARAGLAFGFRRLAILDLTPAGHQPMSSPDGRYVLVFNGEIYNFQELRAELSSAGAAFKGRSDTEVMLCAFMRWGVQESVRRFNGMFAFALWDKAERRLYLVRDRLGEKPLYYSRMGDSFLFGSELKALKAHPDFKAEIDRDALAQYFRFSCIPAPRAIYRSVFKLPPACILVYEAERAGKTSIRSYWSAEEAAREGLENPFEGTDGEAADHLDALLRQAVLSRMVSDVPLGAFLSGGIDSSTVTAMMQSQSGRPVKTFTIGFNESAYDEAAEARAVARHLGTDHHELIATPAEARDVIPLLPGIYDEPFSDSSQIPTHLVSRFARQSVTVSLSGDGGDEVFGGYNRYLIIPRLSRWLGWLPRVARIALKRSLVAAGPEAWDSFFARIETFLPSGAIPLGSGEMIHKLARVLDFRDGRDIYGRFASSWKQTPVIGASSAILPAADGGLAYAGGDLVSWMMLSDQLNYLPNDILVKLDRASMSVSLEARVPLLDHRLVEFAWRLPAKHKVRGGITRRLQRQVLARYVPLALFERPKMGFGIPIGAWLRGPLRDWAEELLGEKRLIDEGCLDPVPIREKWKEHLSGHQSWPQQLWDALMFQAWLESQKVPASR